MKKAVICIVVYSMDHHIFKLAKHIEEGINASGHAECTISRVPKILPEDVLEKLGAPESPDVPIIYPADLPKVDGIIIGCPTHWGSIPAQMKAFLDATGGLWALKGLGGKLGGAFSSSGTQNGGAITTIQNIVAWFSHQSMIFVPAGYVDPSQFDTSAVNGVSPWGIGTIAGGKGELDLSATDIAAAKAYGKVFATYTAKFINSELK